MILGVSSYITSAGLKAVTSGGSSGPYFAIKYFLPIYNYRIDKTICKGYTAGTSAVNISALNLVSATDTNLSTQFEKIFNGTVYGLSQSQSFLFNDSLAGINVGGTSTVTNTRQTLATNINLLNGSPLSNVVSGSTITTNTSGTFTVSNTNVTNAVSFNPISAINPPLSAFYRVTSYSPVSNGVTSASGMFKCKIPASKGSYKFNGLALYASKVDSHGFDDNGNGVNTFNTKPVLVGVVLFDQVQYKQDSVGSVNDFEIKVNLGFDWTTLNASGSSPVYIDTNYWSKMPIASTTSADALSYDGDIVISSSAVPGSWTPRAKLTVTDKDKQQLRLGKDLLHWADFNIVTYGTGDTTAHGIDGDISVLSIDTACPTDSLLQVGKGTSATGIKSIAMGCYAVAGGEGHYWSNPENVVANPLYFGGFTTSIGVDTSALGYSSIAFGNGSLAKGFSCIAAGFNSVASSRYNNSDWSSITNGYGHNIALGYEVSAISDSKYNSTNSQYTLTQFVNKFNGNIAIGMNSIAQGGSNLAFGTDTSAFGTDSVSIGTKSIAQGGSLAIGYGTSAYYYGSTYIGLIAVGFNALANAYEAPAVSLGFQTSATEKMSVAIGINSLSDGNGSIAIGSFTNGQDEYRYSKNAISTGDYSIAIGQSSATSFASVAIGYGARANGNDALAIGKHTSASNNQAISIGNKTYASNGGVSFGVETSALMYSVAIGKYAYANQSNAFSYGYKTSAMGVYSFAYGENAKASGSSSYSFGKDSIAASDNAYTFGYSSNVAGNHSYSFGRDNNVTGYNTMVFGRYIDTNVNDAMIIGTNGNTSEHNYDVISVTGGNTIYIGGTGTETIVLDSSIIKITGKQKTTPKKTLYVSAGTRASEISLTVNYFNESTGNYLPEFKLQYTNGDLSLVGSDNIATLGRQRTGSGNNFRLWYEPLDQKLITTDVGQYPVVTDSSQTWYLLCENMGSLNSDTYNIYDFYTQINFNVIAAGERGVGDYKIFIKTYDCPLYSLSSSKTVEISIPILTRLYLNRIGDNAGAGIFVNSDYSIFSRRDLDDGYPARIGHLLSDKVLLGSFV